MVVVPRRSRTISALYKRATTVSMFGKKKNSIFFFHYKRTGCVVIIIITIILYGRYGVFLLLKIFKPSSLDGGILNRITAARGRIPLSARGPPLRDNCPLLIRVLNLRRVHNAVSACVRVSYRGVTPESAATRRLPTGAYSHFVDRAFGLMPLHRRRRERTINDIKFNRSLSSTTNTACLYV